MPASWILEMNDFSNSKSPCHPADSNQVLAQADSRIGRRCGLNGFKAATMVAILDIKQNRFSDSKSPCCPNAFH